MIRKETYMYVYSVTINQKIIRHSIFILLDGILYNAQGARVE